MSQDFILRRQSVGDDGGRVEIGCGNAELGVIHVTVTINILLTKKLDQRGSCNW